jgi:hypothetical protein
MHNRTLALRQTEASIIEPAPEKKEGETQCQTNTQYYRQAAFSRLSLL